MKDDTSKVQIINNKKGTADSSINVFSFSDLWNQETVGPNIRLTVHPWPVWTLYLNLSHGHND